MEELLQLKQLLHQGNIAEALLLVEELEEMSKSDKINKIFSYGIILLLDLIKQGAENRTTKSWEVSIRNSVKQIQRSNQRHKTKGNYLTDEELKETLEDAYESALNQASLEAFDGIYESEKLGSMVNQNDLIQKALDLLNNGGASHH
jgi:hypothetical protein